MIDKIKSNLTTSYMLFVFDFGDPSTADKTRIECDIKCPLVELFHSQRTVDKAKKQLGREGFNNLLAAYFSQFQSADGFQFKTLDEELNKNKKVFIRHLGRDKMNYLNLIISTRKAIEIKKGLLGVAS